MEFLREQGCDQAQGYWISKPLDGEALLEFLRCLARAVVMTASAPRLPPLLPLTPSHTAVLPVHAWRAPLW